MANRATQYPTRKPDPAFAEKNEAAQAIALTATENHNAASSELDDVPEEVRAQLIGAGDMIAEERLQAVLSTGQPFTLDKIILALWHGFKHSEPRGKVQQRLRKLQKLGVVKQHPNLRSVYQLAEPPVAEKLPQQGPLSKEDIESLSRVG